MKLRIRGNSLRFRIGVSEVVALRESGFLEDCVRFGEMSQLSYRVACDSEAKSISAQFSQNMISVAVPPAQMNAWLESEMVGLEEESAAGSSGVPLRVLLEKDFVCLKPRAGEDDSDGYPHPLEQEGEGAVCD